MSVNAKENLASVFPGSKVYEIPEGSKTNIQVINENHIAKLSQFKKSKIEIKRSGTGMKVILQERIH